MIGLILALAVSGLSAEPEVEPNPQKPGLIVKDEWTPTPPIRVVAPGNDIPVVYEPEPFQCRVEAPFPNTDDCVMPTEPVETDEPEVTPGDVEREVRCIGLPALRTQIQPPGSTLVNLETIFHTTARPFERTVTVLDSTVDLKATPASYTWHHGDGTSRTTTNPGRPYPAMDITHEYDQPGRVSARVDANYRVTFRIDDGPWQTLDATLTAPGPTTPLRIREARPVLTH